MPEREPLAEGELERLRAYLECDRYPDGVATRLLDEHAERGRRIAELERELAGARCDAMANAAAAARENRQRERIAALEAEVRDLGRQRDRALSVVECDRCGHEKFCRVPPPDWEQEPICLGCYDRACAIDAPDAESWPKLKPWGSTRAEALAAHDKERS